MNLRRRTTTALRLGEMEVSNYRVLLVVMDEGRREGGRKEGREGGKERERREGGREGGRERDRKTQRDTCMGIVYICVYVYIIHVRMCLFQRLR